LKKTLGVGIAIAGLLAFVMPFAASAGSDTDRATGGGQVLIGDRGAGDTIAFTARGTEDAATGQVQYVDREGGTGQDQKVLHGTVCCLSVDGTLAKLAGTWEAGGTFELLVVDNGEGAADDDDIVTLQNDQPNDCSQDDDDDDANVALARGNAQVYDADGGE
jgi:hypothetical protein